MFLDFVTQAFTLRQAARLGAANDNFSSPPNPVPFSLYSSSPVLCALFWVTREENGQWKYYVRCFGGWRRMFQQFPYSSWLIIFGCYKNTRFDFLCAWLFFWPLNRFSLRENDLVREFRDRSSPSKLQLCKRYCGKVQKCMQIFWHVDLSRDFWGNSNSIFPTKRGLLAILFDIGGKRRSETFNKTDGLRVKSL